MSATIIVLPVIPVVHTDERVRLQISLSRKDYNILLRCGKQWSLSPEEVAAAMIEGELARRRRKP